MAAKAMALNDEIIRLRRLIHANPGVEFPGVSDGGVGGRYVRPRSAAIA